MPKITDPVKREAFRQKMREIALAKGLGKGRKGKTYEEIYGSERAEAEKEKRVEANRIAKIGKDFSQLKINSKNIAEQRKGKTYEEIYGEEKAGEEILKRQTTHRNKYKDKPEYERNLEKHNSDFRYKEWRKAVFVRDEYTCQECNQHGGKLNAHHIKSWSKFPELRYEISNGKTLCVKCHTEHHRKERKQAFIGAGVNDPTEYLK